MTDAGARRRVVPPLEGGVHVWLTPDVRRFTALGAQLDPDELQRVARLRRPGDRQRLRARRGLLRTVLGRYLDAEPASLAFAYSRYGKPSLAHSGADLEFNLAHSGDTAVLAVSRGHPIGVDVEHVRSDLDVAALAASTCTPRERTALTALPVSRARSAFSTLWVHKEAVAKGDGRGLSLAPSDIEVEAALERGHARVVVPTGTRQESSEHDIWWTRSLTVPDGLAAAIATADGNVDITLRQIYTEHDVRSLLEPA